MVEKPVIGDTVVLKQCVEYFVPPSGREFGDTGRIYELSLFGSLKVHWDRDHYYDTWGYSPSRFEKGGGPW